MATREIGNMRVAITGASGRFGQHLVPYLGRRGASLLLLGRDVARLRASYPGHEYAHVDDIASALHGCDALIDLAVQNNDTAADDASYALVNCDRLKTLLEQVVTANIGRVIALSSSHALDPDDNSPYALSKRSALETIDQRSHPQLSWMIFPKLILRPKSSLSARLWKLAGFIKPTLPVAEALTAMESALIAEDAAERIVVIPDNGQRLTYRLFNFLLDYAFVVAVAIFFGWLMLLIAIAIRLGSDGPALFAQVRVGQHEKPFTLYKFRTMKVGTKQAGTHEVSSAEVTKIGAFLRRYKLDELPQIFNMLRRQVSLVGPRPCLPVQQELIEARRRRGVFDMRPGLTGLAQVREIDMSDPERLAQWDQRYFYLRAALIDIRIVLQTLLGRGGGDRTAA